MPTAAGAHPGLLGPLVIAGFDRSPDVVYLDTALTGQVVERAEDVTHVAALYDTIRAEALPPASIRRHDHRCSEDGMDLTTAVWRKSTYSSGNGGQCVEVAGTPDEWRAFIAGARAREFDL